MGIEAAPAAQPFVGRRQQFHELESAATLATAGQGSLLLLAGEPGVGKTRLAEELAARCRGNGAGVLWASCWEGDGAPPFWPWIQLIRAHVGRSDPTSLRRELGPAGGEIARLVPEVADLVPDVPQPAEHGTPGARFQVYDSVAAFLRRIGHARPHLVVLDDLHWADEPSLHLLRFLAGDLRESGLLVLGIFRDVEVTRGHPLARVLGEMPGGARLLRLDGLGPDEVGELMTALAGGARPHDALVRSVHDRTAGNPFFVREVLRLAGDASEGQDAVPSSVRAVVGRRLRQLSQPCRELLSAAAIVGPEFAVPVLAEVARLPERRLLVLLGEALAARIVEEAGAPGRYRFTHALVREVLVNRVLATRRRELHRRAGEALETAGPAAAEGLEAELACHYRQAGSVDDLPKALLHTERAARLSARLHAHEDAAAHLRRAVELVEVVEPANRRRRAELLLALGEAQMAAGEIAAGRESHERAAAAARELRAPELLARAALGMGAEFAAGATDDLEVSLLEEALRTVDGEDEGLRARLLARLARALLFSPAHQRRTELAEESTRIARGLGDPATLAAVLYARHQALAASDVPEERLRMADEVVRLGEEAGNRTLALEGRALRLGDLVELGLMERFRGELDDYARLLNELRQLTFLWHVPLLRAHLAALGGRFEEAEQLGAALLASGNRIQHRGIDVFHATVITTVRFLQGRFGELVDVLAQGARAHPGLLTFRAGLGVALCESGREEEARAEFERLAAADFRDVPHDLLRPHNLVLLAVTCHALGDARRAELLHGLLLPRAAYNVPLSRIGGTMGATAHYLGLLAGAMDRWDEAVGHFEAAIASHLRQGFPPLLANSRHQLAIALRRRGAAGDADRAETDLEAARSMARALGIRLLLEDRVAARPVARDTSLLREGDVWALTHDGRVARLRDAVGIGLLARLLREPGREFHVLDLASPRGRTALPASDAGPVLDERAKDQYRQRLQELADEMEEAEAWGDPERAARARRETDLLTEELVRAVGLGGRDRRAASDAERARASVTKALRTAIKRIAEHDPELGGHLAVSVRTGAFCAYSPDPASSISWTV